MFNNFTGAMREIFADMELVLVDVDELVSKYLMLSPWQERERDEEWWKCAQSQIVMEKFRLWRFGRAQLMF